MWKFSALRNFFACGAIFPHRRPYFPGISGVEKTHSYQISKKIWNFQARVTCVGVPSASCTARAVHPTGTQRTRVPFPPLTALLSRACLVGGGSGRVRLLC